MFVGDLVEVVTMSPPSLSSRHRLVLKLDDVLLEDETHAQKRLQNSKRDWNVMSSLSCISNENSTLSVVFQNSVRFGRDFPHRIDIGRKLQTREVVQYPLSTVCVKSSLTRVGRTKRFKLPIDQ